MKSPICEICLKAGILCAACQEKISKGEISEKDVEILRSIYNEAEKNNTSNLIGIKKIINSKDSLVIVCSSGSAPKIVGRGGYFAKKLKEDFKKPVRIVEETDDIKSFLQNILFPAPLVNINVLYTPRGETYRIVIPQNSKLPMPLNSIKALAKELLKKEVQIEFE